MASSEFNNLETPRLIIRPFQDSDLEPFLAYRSDPEIERYQGWGDYTRSDAGRFIDGHSGRVPGVPGEHTQIAIELKSTGAMIGDLYLHVLPDEPLQANLGYSLATEYQGAGYATEAVSAFLDYVFGSLNLHRVTAGVDCENERSIALLERIGMRREARFIQSWYGNGKWADEYLYAILRSEWLKSGGEGLPID